MRILIADDDAFYRHSLRKALERWGYEVIMASDGNEALSMLFGPNPPSLTILDWIMPGRDGIDVCRRVRERKGDHYAYLVLVTAKGEKKDVIAGLEAGADDYLIKPFDFEELRVRLQSGQRIIGLHSALAMKQRELSYRATHDSLTGIWNRSAILDIVDREAARAKRLNKPLCLALADIDHFKTINDTYGHVAGDNVLIQVALRMQASIRRHDAVGRYGGEEFVVVMPGFKRRHAFRLAERLRKRVAEVPYEVSKAQVNVTVSQGVAIDMGAGSIEPLLRAADEALYRAKSRGRNCIEFSRAAAPEGRDIYLLQANQKAHGDMR